MIKLSYVSIRNYEKDKYIPPHKHSGWEFIQYLNICGTTTIGDSQYDFIPGTISLIPPEIMHDEKNNGTGQILAIGFDYDEVELEKAMTLQALPYVLTLTQKIQDENRIRSFCYRKLIECALIEIIIYLIRNNNLNALPQDGNNIQEAVNYINEYFMTNIDFDTLSKSAGYSTDHFRILFKNATGKSMKNYILDKRLNLAKKLIRETNLTLDDISLQCGFEYYSHFSLFFKKETGVSPLTYRNKGCNIT